MMSPDDRSRTDRTCSQRPHAGSFDCYNHREDFWVCWRLKRVVTLPEPPVGLLSKGGTLLSKVFGVIGQGFSAEP